MNYKNIWVIIEQAEEKPSSVSLEPWEKDEN